MSARIIHITVRVAVLRIGADPKHAKGVALMVEDIRRPGTDKRLQQIAEIAEMLARTGSDTKALGEPSPNASLKLSVNKITWSQVGRVAEPGRYMFTFGWLTITAHDLAIWQKYPNAAFTLYSTAKAPEANGAAEVAAEEFRLGIFELRSGANYSEGEK